ncbi:hypothetical protein SAMN02745831_03502 [Streptomyces sp. PgraA7]|nr:hypothetical protein SAMN02745831_03502 [Streptomyces sp. PgraA7]
MVPYRTGSHGEASGEVVAQSLEGDACVLGRSLNNIAIALAGGAVVLTAGWILTWHPAACPRASTPQNPAMDLSNTPPSDP